MREVYGVAAARHSHHNHIEMCLRLFMQYVLVLLWIYNSIQMFRHFLDTKIKNECIVTKCKH